ncbi:MAG: hypothetical protein KKB90_12080 [Actinobacteria bacterium]|nr:hypothetical protein [Actinomycetota bacterium]MCG2819074.1 hypothetical protein [Actinomycetes bacterium]MBU4178904.1 hypothetical protein [Actinomycetota bacterium]MBU4219684.1 hypothetical protein [Actinomycetota bacterium]MBU4357707.1 hypothetical protein [Actinomycetota bacterium]
MSKAKPRIQVPVDEEFLAKLDEVSQGRPRAEFMRLCFLFVYDVNRERELERVYREGYKRIPDESSLPEAQARIAGEILSGEPW